MKKIYVIGLLISIVFTISCDNLINKKSTSPYRFIPDESSIILETNDFLGIWNTYSKSSVWGLKEKNPGLQNVYKNLGIIKYTSTLSPAVKASFSSSPTLFSVVSTKSSPSILMVTPTSLTINGLKSIIQENFSEIATIASDIFMEIPVYKIIFSEQEKMLFLAFHHGNLIASYHRPTLERGLEQFFLKKDLRDNKAFTQIKQTTGEHAEGSIYINFRTLPSLFQSDKKAINPSLLEGIANVGEWGALDITAKKNRLLLNGFTAADTSNHLSRFKSKPAIQNMEKILPYSSAVVYSRRFSHPRNLRESIFTNNSSAREINATFKAEQTLFQYPGSHITLALTGSTPDAIPGHTFGYLQTSDPHKAFDALKAIAKKMKPDYYREQYQGYEIIRVPSGAFFPRLLGQSFMNFRSPYFALYNNHLIGCPDKNNLVNLLQALEDGNNIAANDVYNSTVPGITHEANTAVFVNISRAIDLIPGDHPFAKSTRKNRSFYENLNGLSVEFTKTGKYFFSSVFLNAGEKLRKAGEDNWKLKLEAKMVGKPYIVNDHLSAEKRIVAFDALNNMYFINHEGKVLWKHMLSGRPLSKVYEVDAYKNNKVQYLLNTKNHLYLIDVLGRDVGNFPVELPSPATNGLALFDYTGNKYYRIFLAGSDRQIYNFDIEGKQVEGWDKPSMSGKVSGPAQHLVYGHRDYLLFAADNGDVKITNRRGDERISVSENFAKAANSKFYLNRTNSKAPLLTSSRKGELVYIQGDGTTSQTTFGEFTPQHHFFYEKFNKDAHYDFIYFDRNKLTVYDRFKDVITSQNFGEQVLTEPEVISYNGDKALVFTSLTDESLYLITHEGIDEEINRLEGTTLFDIGKLKRFGKESLLVGNDEQLIKYIIE